MADRFPSLRLRSALLAWRLLWVLGLPAALFYLWRRGRKDPLYPRHLGERFGRYDRAMPGAVWVHAVSLGEMRSATPLVRALLDRGERVVTTHFTPAGRREAERAFATDIAQGRLVAVWVPFEFGFAFRRFFRAFRPRYGLVMEVEIWPRMVMEARAARVPLFACNAQYPSRSFARDTSRTPVRAELMRGLAGALVKSELQKERFETVGVSNIAVTGELRFDQPIPETQVAAGLAARTWLAPDRPVIAIASAVEGEDALFLRTIRAVREAYGAAGDQAPLFVYVPRAPERFGPVHDLIAGAGLSVAARSKLFDAALAPVGDAAPPEVLLGDSLGEMNFYLALADRVVVGGGYTPKGSHNIIEPLALKKPVIVGPETWTIEYPAEEAIAAGVCQRITAKDLAAALAPDAPAPSAETIERFFGAHAGGVDKTLAALPVLLDRAG